MKDTLKHYKKLSLNSIFCYLKCQIVHYICYLTTTVTVELQVYFQTV